MLRFTASLFFALVWLTGCAAQPTSMTPPAVLVQWSGPHSGIDQPSSRVIRGAEAWATLWQQLKRDAPQPLGEDQMAVVVFLGQRRTGGYRAQVVGVRREDDELVVEYREHTPGSGAAVTQALTSPWAVATIPASPLPVEVRQLPSVQRGRANR